ncbi:uncharacterized protein BCR38DRAFT_449361 [Pseudomassariella vexata]|uniref:Uncharacterized protein n=1 Tax=Pseudomassariella vexata TaxID=1141098 RepID=A0A1Y2DE70_9PEZI|nr:uncharacterized protein BCR38DRAFT_449361 [Pseudomassariella vexata]ORY57539.1 hypothetical protein BCR38DRAFT_449361 [Pseudomassariella vexata]
MDVVSSYSFASCGWHLVQAIPLIIWPQAINGLLTIDGQGMRPPNDIENYFARSLGFAQIALGLVTVVLTGSLPLNSLVENASDSISPYAAAVLLITMLHHGFTAFYGWTKYNSTDQTGFLLGFIGSVTMAVFGLWCLMFGGDKARISKRTGADKRTSGFPFANAEAGKRKAKKTL